MGGSIGMESDNMIIEISYDKEADAVYLYLSNKKVAQSKELDTQRVVDYSEDGEIRGIEFLAVSNGVTTDDLPHRDEIERILFDRGIKTFA